METRTKNQAMAYFQNLLLVALVDNEFSTEEETFLLAIAKELGLNPDDIESINANLEHADFIIPSDPKEKRKQLTDAVWTMMINGEMEEEEYLACCYFADRLGFPREVVEAIITEIVDFDEGEQDDDPFGDSMDDMENLLDNLVDD